MEAFYFTLVAIILYLAADGIVRAVESRLGRTLQYRSVLFFVLLLGMALVSFTLIRRLAP